MYKLDVRELALHVYAKTNSLRKTAYLLGIKSHATISNWVKRVEVKKYHLNNSMQLKTYQILAVIKCVLEQTPLASLSELKRHLSVEYSIDACKELIRICIKRSGFSWKKVRFYGVSKHQEPLTEEFIIRRNAALAAGKKALFVDEVSFGRNSFKVMGYSPVGEKLMVRKKQPRMTSRSVIACISNEKLVLKHTHEKSVDRLKFLEFLKSLPLDHNTVIFMDNARFHHSSIIKEYIESKSVELIYTPPYSPWFNPIENCFSIIKRKFQTLQDIDASFRALEQRHIVAFYRKATALIGPIKKVKSQGI